MTGFEEGQYCNAVLGVVLIGRLISLRLFSVYSALSCFLLFEIFQSSAFIFISSRLSGKVDYRLIWGAFRFIGWGLLLWTVYAILAEALNSLPGILKFSRRVLNGVFIGAICIGVLTVIPEYDAAGAAGTGDLIRRGTILMLVVERAVTMSAFMSLLAILVFILWFPVKIPRNLVIFSIGLVIYLGSKTCLLLARTYWFRVSDQTLNGISFAIITVLAGCFVCWSLLVSRAGQQSTTRIGHSWRTAEQARLIEQLEEMNNSLLRSRP